MTKRYDKLVRDRIPEIIASQGKRAVVRALPDEEYRARLNEKLLEEVREYLAHNCLEELCDVLEVVDALVKHMGFSPEDAARLKDEKARANGRFEQKLLLEEVTG